LRARGPESSERENGETFLNAFYSVRILSEKRRRAEEAQKATGKGEKKRTI
jgi:hypothetical protein